MKGYAYLWRKSRWYHGIYFRVYDKSGQEPSFLLLDPTNNLLLFPFKQNIAP
jgi:hypothetical protein